MRLALGAVRAAPPGELPERGAAWAGELHESSYCAPFFGMRRTTFESPATALWNGVALPALAVHSGCVGPATSFFGSPTLPGVVRHFFPRAKETHL